MTNIFHVMRKTIVLLTIVAAAGCAGTTSLKENHPFIASDSDKETAKVYFIRPDPGFSGIMDRPVTISLGGSELLSLAKGQYTLLNLKPGNAEIKVDAHTVVGPTNTMTPVSTTAQLDIPPESTLYLVFELVSRGPLNGSAFVPFSVSRDRALEAIQGLNPIGMAINEPVQ